MQTGLLVIHIVAMSVSLVATTMLVAMAVLSKPASKKLLASVSSVTGLGIASGIGLLLYHPIQVQCIKLVTYLVVYLVAYRYVSLRNRKYAPETAKQR